MRKLPILFIALLASMFMHCETAIGQSSMTLFRDTTKRMGSSLAGSLLDKDKSVYMWGIGIGKTSFNVPQVHRIDSNGNKIWSTAKSALYNKGYIARAFADSNFLYAFGIVPVQFMPSTFFFSKIDKTSGNVLLKTDNPNLNVYGIIDVRDKGSDSLRVTCYTYEDADANPNWPPIVSFTINKTNGNVSAPVPYGIQNLAPMFIDESDIAYYYTPSDSLIKYNVANSTILWKNKTNVAGTFTSKPPTNFVKENDKIYLFGDRYSRKIDDNSGSTLWNIQIPSNAGQEFWPSDIVIKNDSIYTTWLHPYSGSIDEYGHFSKINRNTGSIYLNGTITNNSSINYDSSGYFRSYKVIVDNFNDIFLFGNYYNDMTGQRAVKKFSWDGKLLSENKLSVDSVTIRQNNIIEQANLGYATGYLFNNKPCFLYSKYVYNEQQPTVRICFTSLPSDLSYKNEKFFDNDAYQYSSTVVEIKKHDNFIYILKKQGLNIYFEKFSSPTSLLWRRDLSANCYFTPATFSIDSTGVACIIGHSLDCLPNADQYSLTSKFLINKAIFIDPNGTMLNDLQVSGIVTESLLPNLLGTENGFYLAYPGGVAKLNSANGYSLINGSLASNFSNGLSNAQSNKIFLTINDTDSIYVFSSRISNNTDAFYYAVNKQSLTARQSMLTTSFPQGYLLNAIKSRQDGNIAYVSGLTGQGGFPTIIKLNYKTNNVMWKYSLNKIGEAFKVVEDNSGFLYALLKISDSSKILKLDPSNGTVIWQYTKYEPSPNARSIDLDVNSEYKMIVAAGLNIVGNFYRSYFISINTQNGLLTDFRELKGDITEPNYLQTAESIQDSVVIMGGNLNADLLDGKNGYLLFKGSPTATPPCINAYWLGTIDNTWENPGNWVCGVVPGPDSNVIINGGTVVLSSTTTINTFTLSGNASFTINPGFTLTVLH